MKKLIALLTALFIMISCSLPSRITSLTQKIIPTENLPPLPTTVPTVGPITVPTAGPTTLLNLIDNNQIMINGITGNELNASTVGNVLDLHLTNNSGKAVEFEIPCGLILVPEDDSIQQMMVIQPISLSLKSGESADLAPFVVCIQSSNAAPAGGDVFKVGSIADGKLLQLSECFCREEINADQDFSKLMSIQFATWMVADDTDFTDTPTEDGGALGELIGGDNGLGGLGELMGTLITTMAPDAKTWLDKCQIKVGDK